MSTSAPVSVSQLPTAPRHATASICSSSCTTHPGAHLESLEALPHVVHGALQACCDGCMQAGCLVGVALVTQDVVVVADSSTTCLCWQQRSTQRSRAQRGNTLKTTEQACAASRHGWHASQQQSLLGVLDSCCVQRSCNCGATVPACCCWRCCLRTTKRCGSCVSASANSVLSKGMDLQQRKTAFGVTAFGVCQDAAPSHT